MLILCSDGLTSDALLRKVAEHSQTAKKAAVVVTADNEYKEKNYHVERVVQELGQLGMEAECFDVDKQEPNILLDYDAVEFIGGNPFYLLDSLHRTHAKDILYEIIKQKILIGWSAGAVVMGRSLELINKYTPEMNFMGLKDLTALQLADFDILPHYNKFVNRFERFEEKCREYEEQTGCEVIRLNDGDGILINETIQLIRGNK